MGRACNYAWNERGDACVPARVRARAQARVPSRPSAGWEGWGGSRLIPRFAPTSQGNKSRVGIIGGSDCQNRRAANFGGSGVNRAVKRTHFRVPRWAPGSVNGVSCRGAARGWSITGGARRCPVGFPVFATPTNLLTIDFDQHAHPRPPLPIANPSPPSLTLSLPLSPSFSVAIFRNARAERSMTLSRLSRRRCQPALARWWISGRGSGRSRGAVYSEIRKFSAVLCM